MSCSRARARLARSRERQREEGGVSWRCEIRFLVVVSLGGCHLLGDGGLAELGDSVNRSFVFGADRRDDAGSADERVYGEQSEIGWGVWIRSSS